MKELSIQNPWPWAIFHLPEPFRRDIENRTWPTNFRGTIAVHATKARTKIDLARDIETMAYMAAMSGAEERDILAGMNKNYPWETRAIVGTVEIVDCISKSEFDSVWFQGDYGFVLRNPIVLPNPIPCKGALGFWTVPSEIEAEIIRQTKERE